MFYFASRHRVTVNVPLKKIVQNVPFKRHLLNLCKDNWSFHYIVSGSSLLFMMVLTFATYCFSVVVVK